MTSTAAERIGVWLVGARGSVATTTVVGALAVRSGLSDSTGLASALPEVAAAGLPDLGDLVLGGHDVDTGSLGKRAEVLAAGGVFPPALLPLLQHELAEVDARSAWASTPTVRRDPGEGIERVQRDLERFRDEHGLARVVVLDVSSTEPPVADPPPWPTSRRSSAALEAGGEPAADQLGLRARGLPRRLRLRRLHPARARGCRPWSWPPSGTAAVGRARRQDRRDAAQVGARADVRDARPAGALVVGHQPARRRRRRQPGRPGGQRRQGRQQAARCSRRPRLPGRTGRCTSTTCPTSGDFKTAWDLITFEGFLGTRMTMEFTWHGCDSALAAPLVLDLARLTARRARGRPGRAADRARLLLQGPARRATTHRARRPSGDALASSRRAPSWASGRAMTVRLATSPSWSGRPPR